jgi:hypothetical protein
MLVMVCTRCHQREAIVKNPAPEIRAKAEELFGVPWPFPDSLCQECLEELQKDPEYRARLEAFRKAAGTKTREIIETKLRDAALKVLDYADRLAGKF